MARTVIVTGGARSGKSAYAESLYSGRQQVTYIAVARISDEEMQERIHMHQQSRPHEWTTVEGTYDLAALAKNTGNTALLLDCVTVLASNIMFDITQHLKKIPPSLQLTIEQTVMQEIEKLMQYANAVDGELIMVTNEIGCSVVPENHLARVYRDILGRINQRIAALCDEAYLVACGIPLRLK